MRKSFVFYRSFYESIANCPDEMQLLLFRAVILYALDQVEPTFDGLQYQQFLVAIWAGIRPQLDANTQRYLNGCKGGAPIGNQNARKQPNNNQKQPNVNDNVNDNENEKVYIERKSTRLRLPFADKEFVSAWNSLRQQPKWKGKTSRALQMCLDQLSRYDVKFAISLMETAIANNYQGVVFNDTDKHYEQWQQRNPKPAHKGEIITKIEDLFEG